MEGNYWLLVLLGLLFRIHSGRSQPVPELLYNTTHLLDTLLKQDVYDRRIRPGFGGAPTVIHTDIEIRSFGPISETEMIYSMDCYFRQTWIDPRLKFKSESLKVLSMDWNFLKRVWIPDTFFLNGRSSYLHKVTVPNKFIRVRENGQLRYSMRLTIKASCPMHLRKYPLDTQACPLEIGSFAYPSHEVTYEWKSDDAVQISKDVTLSQYEILKVTLSNFTTRGAEGGKRSTLRVIFLIRRNRGYFILQIYAPCAMIVGASWVSFWINRSDAAGRVAVGATTVLTLVTMGFGGRGSHQRVAYATALDWFVIMCFSFVFSALVEYAFVNFIDHYEKRQLKKNLDREREQKKKKEVTQEDHAESSAKEPAVGRSPTGSDLVRLHIDESEDKDNHVTQQQQQLQQLVQSRPPRIGLRLRRRPFTAGRCSLDKGGYKSRQIASKVDTYARIAFPVTFAVLNILYWTLFLHTIDDETTIEEPTIDESGGGAFVT